MFSISCRAHSHARVQEATLSTLTTKGCCHYSYVFCFPADRFIPGDDTVPLSESHVPDYRQQIPVVLGGIDGVVKLATSDGVLYFRATSTPESTVNNRASLIAKRLVFGDAALASGFGAVLYGAYVVSRQATSNGHRLPLASASSIAE